MIQATLWLLTGLTSLWVVLNALGNAYRNKQTRGKSTTLVCANLIFIAITALKFPNQLVILGILSLGVSLAVDGFNLTTIAKTQGRIVPLGVLNAAAALILLLGSVFVPSTSNTGLVIALALAWLWFYVDWLNKSLWQRCEWVECPLHHQQ